MTRIEASRRAIEQGVGQTERLDVDAAKGEGAQGVVLHGRAV